jgi:hypothetical protein
VDFQRLGRQYWAETLPQKVSHAGFLDAHTPIFVDAANAGGPDCFIASSNGARCFGHRERRLLKWHSTAYKSAK